MGFQRQDGIIVPKMQVQNWQVSREDFGREVILIF
jgi:hypothetical protein